MPDVYDQRDAAEIRAEFAERRLAAYERLETAARAWLNAEPPFGEDWREHEWPLVEAIRALPAPEVTP